VSAKSGELNEYKFTFVFIIFSTCPSDQENRGAGRSLGGGWLNKKTFLNAKQILYPPPYPKIKTFFSQKVGHGPRSIGLYLRTNAGDSWSNRPKTFYFNTRGPLMKINQLENQLLVHGP